MNPYLISYPQMSPLNSDALLLHSNLKGKESLKHCDNTQILSNHELIDIRENAESLAPSSEDSEASSEKSADDLNRNYSFNEKFDVLQNLNQMDLLQEQRLLNIKEVFHEMFNPNEKVLESDGNDQKIEVLHEEYLTKYNMVNNSYSLFLQESYCLESILFKYRRKKKTLRNAIYSYYFAFIKDILSYYCYKLINWPFFRLIISNLILLNLGIYIYKSLNSQSMDTFYLIIAPIYCLELMIRFVGLGPRAILKSTAYLLDMCIIIGLLLTILLKSMKNHSFESFFQMPWRIFRLPSLMNLRQISNIFEGILSSVKVLGETMWFLMIFCSFYALAGIQLFSGVLKNRCFYENTGLLTSFTQDVLCGNVDCGSSCFCGRFMTNPDNDATSFDNFLASLIQVLRVITWDGWTAVMNLTQKGLTNYSSIYFISLALLGNFFILNFFLAVLKVRFDDFQQKFEQKSTENTLLTYDIRKLKTMGVYYQKNTITNRMSSSKRVSFSLGEFQKTVLSFIRKKVYNFEDNKNVFFDQDLRKTLRNRLFIVEVKKDEKYISESKDDVIPLRKALKYMKELANLKLKAKRHKMKSSFLSNFSIFRENLRQIEQKVIDLATNTRRISKKPSQKLDDLKRLCHDYESIEKMQSTSNRNVSPSVFALNKQTTLTFQQKTPNQLLSKLLTNNESLTYYNSSQNSTNQLNRFKTSKLGDSESSNTFQQSDSNMNLLNILPLDNRLRSKSSPNRSILDKNRGILNKKSNASNPSYENNNNCVIVDNSASSKRSFIRKLSSNFLMKRRGSFIINSNSTNTQNHVNFNDDKSKDFISISTQKSRKSTTKVPIFAGKRSIMKTSIKTSVLLAKNSRFLMAKQGNSYRNSPLHSSLNNELENIKKKDFGYQKFLEKKFNISLKHGVNLTYEQAKTIINESFEENALVFHSNKKKYLKIFQEDFEKKKFSGSIWSGGDLEISLSLKKLKRVLLALTYYDLEIWIKGFKGKIVSIRRFIKGIIESGLWQGMTITMIIGYLILLCLEGFVDDGLWGQTNIGFMVFFSMETMLKIGVLGVKEYFRDSLNILDFLCQIQFIGDFLQYYQIFDIDSIGGLSFLLVFKGLYPLKMLRLMLNSPYIRAIGHIIRETLKPFIAISMLLSFLILLYALYGMQLYSGYYVDNYNFQMTNFHDLTSAVSNVFLIINFVWISNFQALFSLGANFYSLSFYNITLIFFGHLIMLNLFIALMLRGFETSEEGEFETEKEEANDNEKKHESLQSEENGIRKSLKPNINEHENNSSEANSDNSNSSNENSSDSSVLEPSEAQNNIVFSLVKRTVWVKKKMAVLIKSKNYRKFTSFMIILTLISLALETYDGLDSIVMSLKFILNGYFMCDLTIYWLIFGNKSELLRKIMMVIEFMILTGFLFELVIQDGVNLFIIQVYIELFFIRNLN